MKWNWSRFSTPRDLSSRTTLARLVRWISGTVVVNRSSLDRKMFEQIIGGTD